MSSEQFSEIVQLPAVRMPGMEEILNPKLMLLDEIQLKQMAQLMGGELVYRKVRATYTKAEQEFCNKKDCYRIAVKGQFFCEDHGGDKSKLVKD